jgi:ribosomal protein L37E
VSRKAREHWYAVFHHECPVCGHGKTIRERRYSRKPARYEERVQYVEQYDYCLGW